MYGRDDFKVNSNPPLAEAVRWTGFPMLPLLTLAPPAGIWREREVAIKIVTLPDHTTEEMLARCEEEAALGLCLRHPNIVSTFTAFTVQQHRMARCAQPMVMGQPLRR